MTSNNFFDKNNTKQNIPPKKQQQNPQTNKHNTEKQSLWNPEIYVKGGGCYIFRALYGAIFYFVFTQLTLQGMELCPMQQYDAIFEHDPLWSRFLCSDPSSALSPQTHYQFGTGINC